MAEARDAIEYTKQKRDFDLFLVNENDDGTITLSLITSSMAMAPEYHKGILQVAELPYFVWSLARIANNVACCDHNSGPCGVTLGRSLGGELAG